jgi:hypothetical protein
MEKCLFRCRIIEIVNSISDIDNNRAFFRAYLCSVKNVDVVLHNIN